MKSTMSRALKFSISPATSSPTRRPATTRRSTPSAPAASASPSPQFSKIDVLGENAIPLYKWLSENTKFEGFGMSPMGLAMNGIAKKMDKDFKKNGNVKWNFTKFLISREGEILARFEPTVPMKTVMEKVKAVL